MRALAQAVESLQNAWWVGRGRSIDRSALEKTDAVTSTFIDCASEIANEQEGDAEVLLQVLRNRSDERVGGFRSAKADGLESYLRENDFLDPRDRRSPEVMWQYLLADFTTARRDGLLPLRDLGRPFGWGSGGTPSQLAS